MPEEVSIRVNFSRTIPVFPLGQVVMLPQQITPLHIFEPRYRQMVDRALDGAGQIALARFEGDLVTGENPPIRPAVCIGQIVQHEKLDDGRYNIILQGVCRARIAEEEMPDGERMYREALLEPIGDDDDEGGEAEGFRDWFRDELRAGSLSRLVAAEELMDLVRNNEIPSPVLVEIISFALVNDDRTRYRLLAEGSLGRRTGLVRENLESLSSLIRRAVEQDPGAWPKGMSWN